MDDPRSGPLRLTLQASVLGDPALRFPVTARFTNISDGHVRLLDLFDPLPVFFTTRLAPVAGAEIDVAGAGKLEPLEGSLRYVDLAPGASFEAALDLAPWIRAGLEAGPHTLAMSYHNAYGTGCFRGRIESAPIAVSVGPKDG